MKRSISVRISNAVVSNSTFDASSTTENEIGLRKSTSSATNSLDLLMSPASISWRYKQIQQLFAVNDIAIYVYVDMERVCVCVCVLWLTWEHVARACWRRGMIELGEDASALSESARCESWRIFSSDILIVLSLSLSLHRWCCCCSAARFRSLRFERLRGKTYLFFPSASMKT